MREALGLQRIENGITRCFVRARADHRADLHCCPSGRRLALGNHQRCVHGDGPHLPAPSLMYTFATGEARQGRVISPIDVTPSHSGHRALRTTLGAIRAVERFNYLDRLDAATTRPCTRRGTERWRVRERVRKAQTEPCLQTINQVMGNHSRFYSPGWTSRLIHVIHGVHAGHVVHVVPAIYMFHRRTAANDHLDAA
jgi:hypothetical protein